MAMVIVTIGALSAASRSNWSSCLHGNDTPESTGACHVSSCTRSMEKLKKNIEEIQTIASPPNRSSRCWRLFLGIFFRAVERMPWA
uniref:Putative secreted protein n=1 Tax=Anopheles darlingi TaxID=43151 RepID=A0A2M4DB98_ANODA